MATFLLVHGAWHGGWCWEELTPRLELLGHRVLAPDLPGIEGDLAPLADVSLDRLAHHVAALVAAEPEPVILVGHGRGGIVISRAAELRAGRIAGLVYLAAFLVPDGRTMREAGIAGRTAAPARKATEAGGTLSLDPATAASQFYHLTPSAFIARILPRLRPEAARLFDTPLRLSDARFGRIPRAYIEAAQDRALSLERQRAMQAELPCQMQFTLPSDHSPFYSMVEPLCDALRAIARALPERRMAA